MRACRLLENQNLLYCNDANEDRRLRRESFLDVLSHLLPGDLALGEVVHPLCVHFQKAISAHPKVQLVLVQQHVLVTVGERRKNVHRDLGRHLLLHHDLALLSPSGFQVEPILPGLQAEYGAGLALGFVFGPDRRQEVVLHRLGRPHHRLFAGLRQLACSRTELRQIGGDQRRSPLKAVFELHDDVAVLLHRLCGCLRTISRLAKSSAEFLTPPDVANRAGLLDRLLGLLRRVVILLDRLLGLLGRVVIVLLLGLLRRVVLLAFRAVLGGRLRGLLRWVVLLIAVRGWAVLADRLLGVRGVVLETRGRAGLLVRGCGCLPSRVSAGSRRLSEKLKS